MDWKFDMAKVVVVGGGISGCASALNASKAGAKVTLVERLGMLGGASRRSGRLKNGDFVAFAEGRALGAGELFDMFEEIALHRKGIAGEDPVLVYDCGLVHSTLLRILKDEHGIDVIVQRRAIDVERNDYTIKSIVLNDGQKLEADSFVDASGTVAGVEACIKYGNGCVMCLYMCPAYGDPVSIATKAGAKEKTRIRNDGRLGSVGAAATLVKDSLSKELQERLQKEGTILVPLPPDFVQFNLSKLKNEMGAPRTEEQMKTLNLVNIGPVAKLVGIGRVPLEMLRSVKGFENVEPEDPKQPAYNKIAQMSIVPTDESMKVDEFHNLFAAGAHSAFTDGVIDCLCTGLVAGHNAVRAALGMPLITLPRTLVMGDFIASTREMARSYQKGMIKEGNMGAGPYYKKMLANGLFCLDPEVIRCKVEQAGLVGIFGKRLT
jgi:hypothetical protein